MKHKAMIIYLLCLIITCITVVDPDLQIRGVHPDPEKRGGPQSPIKIFSALRTSVSSKNCHCITCMVIKINNNKHSGIV